MNKSQFLKFKPCQRLGAAPPDPCVYQQKLPAEISRLALACRYIFHIKTHGSELHNQANYVRCLTLQSFLMECSPKANYKKQLYEKQCSLLEQLGIISYVTLIPTEQILTPFL